MSEAHDSETSVIRELADRYALGNLSPVESDRLGAMLRDNPVAQRQFLEVAGIHARIREEFAHPDLATPATGSRFHWRSLGAVALAACLLLGTAVYLLSPRPDADAVAVLQATAQPRWSNQAPDPGAQLSAGRLQLESGVAEIAFRGGAVAVVQGPAEFELVDASRAVLHAGRVVVRVPHGASAFELSSVFATIAHGGAEFGVGVSPDVQPVLQVYEGEVRVATEEPAVDSRTIEGGQAVRLAPGLGEVPFQPDRFVRALPGPDDPSGRGKLPYNKSRHQSISIVPPPGPVTIDANLGDWDLRHRVRAECEPPYGKDHHLDAAMMFDEKFLYVGAHVGDPFPMRSTVSPHENRELYGMGGAVALRISTDRRAGWPVPGLGRGTEFRRPPERVSRNEKLASLVLWYHAPTGEACLHARYGMDHHGAVVNPPGYRGAFRRDADDRGYTLEYAIPWSVLHAADDPPRAGDTLGAMCLVHWSDPGGRVWKGQLIEVENPRERGWNFDNAGTWGKAIYLPRPK